MESHLNLLGIAVRCAERLCEGEHKRNSALCLLYKIYLRLAHPMEQYLNHFVAARNIRALAGPVSWLW